MLDRRRYAVLRERARACGGGACERHGVSSDRDADGVAVRVDEGQCRANRIGH